MKDDIDLDLNKDNAIPYFTPKNFKSPIIICGCHGGGTSLVAKILRHLGVFLGNDAGSIYDRKLHESHRFRHFNQLFLNIFAPGSPQGMMTTSKAQWKRYWEGLANPVKLKMALNYIKMDVIFETYSFKVKQEQGKMPKGPVLYGWKDPRNSITLKIWKKIFPEAKILVVHSPHFKGPSHSSSGNWFKNESDKQTRDIYMYPPHLDTKKDNYLFFDYKKGIKEVYEFNKLTKWLGLKPLTQQAFEHLKKEVSYEG